MTQPTVVIDVGDAEFEREVLERSRTTPVVVDLWAPWCGPCQALGPLLERLAVEHAGAFVLAKVNVDEAPAVAQGFGVRSIPMVLGLRDGRVVSEFVGAKPEAAVREFLRAVLPSDADRVAAEGRALVDRGDLAGAEERFRTALAADPRHGAALLGMARVAAERGEVDEAIRLVERVPATATMVEEAERFAAELRTRVDGGGDEAALRARLVEAPQDAAARIALGRTLAAARRWEEALAELLAAVQQDPHFDDDAARRAMLDVFTALGPDDPLADRFRGELAKALYR